MNSNKKSIKNQLTSLLSIIAFISLLVFSLVNFYYNYNNTKKNTIESLSLLTQIMGHNLIASIEFNDKTSTESILNTLNLNPNIDAALLYNHSGVLFTSYIRSNTDYTAIQHLINNFPIFIKNWNLTPFEQINTDNIFINRPILMNKEHIGSLLLIVNTQQFYQYLIEYIRVQIIILVSLLIFILIISQYLQRIFTTPIIKLKNTMASISQEKKYTLRINRTKNDEFKELYTSFNNMLDIIEYQHQDLDIQQQQLISEVADKEQSEYLAEFAKQRLENITNSIPNVVCQFQYTFGSLVVSYISNNISKFHYIEPIEILKDFNVFILSIHPKDQELVNTKINNAIATKSSFSCEYRVLLQEPDLSKYQGDVRWIRLQSLIIQDDDDDDDDDTDRETADIELFDEIISLEDIKFNSNLIDITETKIAHETLLIQQKEIKEIHKKTRDSIQYASLIQTALIPDHQIFRDYFSDFFAIWHPKDIVGGDIYLVEPLNENELLIMVIDCTGHGVPGAFGTMLVKAIERQIIADLKVEQHISPANILSIFNKEIKYLLKQDSKNSASNAGFDGGILYFNKQKKIVRYAGAETPLFIIQNNTLKTIKGSRHSIGYKSSDPNFEFTEHEIDVSIDTQIYITTDGYLDQNGGKKSFPFGKKQFQNIIKHYDKLSFSDQQEHLLYALDDYQKSEERNDDITVIGLKIQGIQGVSQLDS